ncbi:NAD(P)-binding domain-containing protein (plasmid) [Pseudohalocynthiibacter aestuariivivens]|uniref:NAD(P)-binding domain-containing protein n=1 Tax=Roseovarius pelagicus TaxID=2980108 RepID=A0ABY6D627_9RHOB|nr:MULTISPECIES: NAD(P)-binding domain-containing protein [Rhodobacterales]QIE47901.1 NAD(P)-binding domain-containing protein [Pseudohalocynthiibacter aestuariivivens]UXX81591.1 NAD(P)-binding domain-containing protein [Roseovarius pelagicus]
MRIGITGLGTIASSVVRGLVNDGHQIVVSERSIANASALSRTFGNVTVASNQRGSRAK